MYCPRAKKRMSERLSESQMCDLVKIYKEHDCLWDLTNENYKNREARDKAYKEICEKLYIPGLQVTDIPQKIKNLRTSYHSELRKIEASIKDGGKVHKPKVAWFSVADEVLRPTRNTLASSQNDKTKSEPKSNILKTNAKEPSKNVTPPNKDKTPKTIANLEKIAIKLIPQATPGPSSEPQTKHEEDEFDLYGKYIAMSLRSMPKEMSIIARMELQNTMADIQLKNLRQGKRVCNPEECGSSTLKMEEDPLKHALEETEQMEQIHPLETVKVEVDDDD